jgi:hypothetical protein
VVKSFIPRANPPSARRMTAMRTHMEDTGAWHGFDYVHRRRVGRREPEGWPMISTIAVTVAFVTSATLDSFSATLGIGLNVGGYTSPDDLPPRPRPRPNDARGAGAVSRGRAMITPLSQMSEATLTAALRASGFQIRGSRVWDISGVCPGFAITAVLRRGRIDRAATLARAVAARQEAVAKRRPRAWNDGDNGNSVIDPSE